MYLHIRRCFSFSFCPEYDSGCSLDNTAMRHEQFHQKVLEMWRGPLSINRKTSETFTKGFRAEVSRFQPVIFVKAVEGKMQKVVLSHSSRTLLICNNETSEGGAACGAVQPKVFSVFSAQLHATVSVKFTISIEISCELTRNGPKYPQYLNKNNIIINNKNNSNCNNITNNSRISIRSYLRGFSG